MIGSLKATFPRPQILRVTGSQPGDSETVERGAQSLRLILVMSIGEFHAAVVDDESMVVF
jgi:hypothetical protein